MEFRRFESAVRKYGDRRYTMCDFLNLVKAAARDISDEYGIDIYELSTGDEDQFADLIANQCFMISEMMDTAKATDKTDERKDRLRRELGELGSDAELLVKNSKELEALREKKSALESEMKEIENQKEEYGRLQKDIAAINESINNADKIDTESAKKELEALKNMLDTKTQEIYDLETQISECRNKISDAKKEHSEKTQEKEVLDSVLKDTEEKLKNCVTECTNTNEEIRKLNEKIKKAENADIPEADKLLKDTRSSLEVLQGRFQEKTQEIYDLETLITECKNKISGKEKELSEKTAENTALNDKLKKETENLEALRKSNETLEASIIKMQESFSQAKKTARF